MIALGLTGGMGMGKSTVARMFVERGIEHWDADASVAMGYGWRGVDPLTRELWRGVAPLVPVIEKHLPDAITRDPVCDFVIVDREKLRAAVVGDPGLLNRIEQEVGPWLIDSALSFAQAMQIIGQPNGVPVLFDAPLWFEQLGCWAVQSEREFDQVLLGLVNRTTRTLNFALRSVADHVLTVVVTCPASVQRKRCFARPGMTEEKFQLLVSRQLSDEDRRRRADFVIDTTETLDAVSAQVDHILAEIKQRHG
jgi:dephospho-CoA kinase